MYEKVNPSHPDKVADRIAGALVDLAYAKEENSWSGKRIDDDLYDDPENRGYRDDDPNDF